MDSGRARAAVRAGECGWMDRGFAEWRSVELRARCCKGLRLRIGQTCRGLGQRGVPGAVAVTGRFLYCQAGAILRGSHRSVSSPKDWTLHDLAL